MNTEKETRREEEASERGHRFGFSERWFSLGLVPDGLLARMQQEWDRGQDHNPEHYRYWAFKEFLAAHRPLDPRLAEALFALGDADEDQSMGGAMMGDIVRLPECPPIVLAAALASGRKHLVRMMERRRA
jgi:hypothetical protein